MVRVLLGPNGEVEVLETASLQDMVEAKASFLRLVKALAQVVVERDRAAVKTRADKLDGQMAKASTA